MPHTTHTTQTPKVEIDKFKALLGTFEIEAGNMQQSMEKAKQDTLDKHSIEKHDTHDTHDVESEIIDVESDDTVITAIAKSDLMMEDFELMRRLLRRSIKSASNVLDKYEQDLLLESEEGSAAEMIESFSSLIKGINDTSKAMTSVYTQFTRVQKDVKMLNTTDIKTDQPNNVTNNVFIGSPQDLLKQLQAK